MAVEVVRGHHAGGAELMDKFDEGQRITVDDGHLHVRQNPTSAGGAGKVVAVFAPSKWASARVVAETKS